MTAKTFLYTTDFIPASPAFPNGHEVSRPLVNIVAVNGRECSLCALVDSGSDYTCFSAELLSHFQLDPAEGKLERVQMADGREARTWFFEITIQLEGLPEMKMYAGFLEDWKNPADCILGQQGFFDKASVHFSHEMKGFIVEV